MNSRILLTFPCQTRDDWSVLINNAATAAVGVGAMPRIAAATLQGEKPEARGRGGHVIVEIPMGVLWKLYLE